MWDNLFRILYENLYSLSLFSLWAVGKQKSLLLSLKHSETVTQFQYVIDNGLVWNDVPNNSSNQAKCAEEGERENDEPLFRYLSVSPLPLSLYKRMYVSCWDLHKY